MTRLVLLAALSLGGCDDDDTTNDPVMGADARPATPDAGGTTGTADGGITGTPDGGITGTPDAGGTTGTGDAGI